MPTTILDGETLPQAYARRFAEEAETEARIAAQSQSQSVYPVNAWAQTGQMNAYRDFRKDFYSHRDCQAIDAPQFLPRGSVAATILLPPLGTGERVVCPALAFRLA